MILPTRSIHDAPVLPDPHDVPHGQHPQPNAGTAGSSDTAAAAAAVPAGPGSISSTAERHPGLGGRSDGTNNADKYVLLFSVLFLLTIDYLDYLSCMLLWIFMIFALSTYLERGGKLI